MTTIFIDGESGTTGLRLRERIANRADLKLISLPADERRSPDARLEAMKAADVTVLCLPDDAAREAVKLADEAGTRVLDASSAHRTAPEWVYGMPELMNGRAAEIARASRVSVPGCHASGFILLVAPLVSAGIIAPDAFLEAVKQKGAWLTAELEKIPGVKDVSGLGLMLGFSVEGCKSADIKAKALDNGLVVLTAKDRVRLLPPLAITEEELSDGLLRLAAAIREVQEAAH